MHRTFIYFKFQFLGWKIAFFAPNLSWTTPSRTLGWVQWNFAQLTSGHWRCAPYFYLVEILNFGLKNSIFFCPKHSLDNSSKTARLIWMELDTTKKWTLKLCTVLLFIWQFNFWLEKYHFCPKTFLDNSL